MPNVDAKPVYDELGPAERKALVDWVHAGGRYVGWQEGATLASALGVSSVGLSKPKAHSPGALMGVRTTRGPNEIMWDDYYGLQMSPAGSLPSSASSASGTLSGVAALSLVHPPAQRLAHDNRELP